MVVAAVVTSAPAELHDQLDKVFPVLDHMRRLGMTSQVVLYWTAEGKPGRFKVSAAEADRAGGQ